jgi:hypothetical protein
MKNRRNKNKNEIVVENQKENKHFSFDEMKEIINGFGINKTTDDEINRVKNLFANKDTIQNIMSKNLTNIDSIYNLAESYVYI